MNKAFIKAKASSRLNLHFLLSPIVGYLLLLVGEFIGIFALIPVVLTLPYSEFTNQVLTLGSFAFISLVVLLWARLVEQSPWLGLGIRKKAAGKDFLLGWGLGAAMLTSCVLLMMVAGAVTIRSVSFNGPLLGQFLILTLAWSIQGTTEELLARGWMFSSLAAKHNIPIATLVSSLFFAALHLQNNAISLIPFLDLVLFAVLACLVMLKTGNLWVISGIHAAWNCFQGNFFAFPVSGTHAGAAFIQVHTQGPDWLSGGEFGVEGSVISLLVQGLIITWLYYDLYIKEKTSKHHNPAQ